MLNLKRECEDFADRRRIVVAVDGRNPLKKYRAENIDENLVAKYRVDGCILTDGNKCDYLILNLEKRNAYFIELKGRHLLEAVGQVEGTLNVLERFLSENMLFMLGLCLHALLRMICGIVLIGSWRGDWVGG